MRSRIRRCIAAALRAIVWGILASGGQSAAATTQGPVVGPDLVLWLDAQDIAGGKKADAPADKAAIATWADKSGYGNHATQAVEGRRPTYVRDALVRGRHAVRFRAARKQSLSSGKRSSLDLGAITAYVVARAEPCGGAMWLFSKNRWGPAWVGYGIAVDGQALRPWPHLGLERGARGYLKLNDNLGAGFRLVEVVYDGRLMRTWLDGRRDAQQTVRGRILASGRDLTIGARDTQFLEGWIAEILLYRRALSDKERELTRKYLLGKYGLPVVQPAGRPSPLEADWLFQADGKPLPERAMNEIGWARALADRLAKNPKTPKLDNDLAELDGLEKRLKSLLGGTADPATGRKLYLAVRRVKRRIVFKNPVVDFSQVLFIDQPYPRGSESRHEAIHRLGIKAVSGGRLLVLEGLAPDAPVRQIGPKKAGSYWRPDLSFDGKKVLFCYKAHDEKAFHLYEVDLDGRGLRQLTSGDYDDIDPIYLPDGHIMFTTTRGNTYVRCGPYIYSYILARCDADGRNIYLISQNSEPDFVPALLNDGRVIYSRWEYSDKDQNRVQSLWTTNQDGTATSAFWGNQSVWPDHTAEPRAIPGSRRVMFSSVGHHDWFTGSIGIIDPDRGTDYPHGLTRVTWERPWAEVGAGPADRCEAADYHSSGRYTSYKTPQPLSEQDFLVSARGGDGGGKFRLYLMDVRGNRELIYEGAHNVWHAMPVRARSVTPRQPDMVAWPGTGKKRKPLQTGLFYNIDVYRGVSELPRGSVKHLRVFQQDAKTYSTWAKTFAFSGPPVSAVQSEAVKRIVSTVPVEADGSVYFEAPAGRTLFFQLLDAHGRALHTMRSFVGLLPGERRGCVGCHELQVAAAPPNRPALALRRPPTPVSPPPWGSESIGYERFVQPVLDRHCGKCHQGDGKGRKKLDLTLRPSQGKFRGHFKEPYLTLIGPAAWPVQAPGKGRPGYGLAGAFPVYGLRAADVYAGEVATNKASIILKTMRPMRYLSCRSRLIDRAMSGRHNKVKVQGVDLERLIAWVDANCPYLGAEEIRTMSDPDFRGIEQLPIRPRVKTAPVIERP